MLFLTQDVKSLQTFMETRCPEIMAPLSSMQVLTPTSVGANFTAVQGTRCGKVKKMELRDL